jgi:hypothetical protein
VLDSGVVLSFGAAIAVAAMLAAPTQSATTKGEARSLTLTLLARNGSGQSGTALLIAVQQRTLVRIRLGRPVKFPGRQVILVRPVRCAAYVRKLGDDFA